RRNRKTSDLAHATAAGVDAEAEAWVEVGRGELDLRARRLDARERRFEIEIVRERLVDECGQPGVVEVVPPRVEMHVAGGGRGQLELRRRRRRCLACREQSGGENDGERGALTHAVLRRARADAPAYAERGAATDADGALRRGARRGCAARRACAR